MTEATKDIAALMRDMRDLADRIVECQGENSDGEEIIHLYDQSDTTFKAQNILLVLNAFEELRQRADANAKEIRRLEFQWEHRAPTQWAYDQACTALHAQRERAEKADAELAALKGDQVPVALVDERQGSGGFCLTQHGRRLNLQHGTELFTAPQKPVLHPQLLSDIRQCAIDATAWCTHRTPPDYVSNVNAWLAAGGIVKNGE